MGWFKTKTFCGLKISNNKVPNLPSAWTYERALAIFTEECSKHFNKDLICKALSSVVLEWWDKIAPRPSNGELDTVVVDEGFVYSGLTVGFVCKVAWRGKLFRSAFCHELLHIISREINGTEDPEHTSYILWGELEMAINKRLMIEGL